jgi:hypothetical protein
LDTGNRKKENERENFITIFIIFTFEPTGPVINAKVEKNRDRTREK